MQSKRTQTNASRAALLGCTMLAAMMAASVPAYAQSALLSDGRSLGGGVGSQAQSIIAPDAVRNIEADLVRRGVPPDAARAATNMLAQSLGTGRQNEVRLPSGLRVVTRANPPEGNCRLGGIGFIQEGGPARPFDVRLSAPWCLTARGWGNQPGELEGSLPAQQQQATRAEPPRLTPMQPATASAPYTVTRELDETRIMRITTPLRAAPTATAASLGNLIAGTRVQLTGMSQGSPWVRIYTNRKVGYALADSLNPPTDQPAPAVTEARGEVGGVGQEAAVAPRAAPTPSFPTPPREFPLAGPSIPQGAQTFRVPAPAPAPATPEPHQAAVAPATKPQAPLLTPSIPQGAQTFQVPLPAPVPVPALPEPRQAAVVPTPAPEPQAPPPVSALIPALPVPIPAPAPAPVVVATPDPIPAPPPVAVQPPAAAPAPVAPPAPPRRRVDSAL